MSGGSKKQTTTENKVSDPWGPAVPALQSIVGKTEGLLNSGAGTGVYTGQRYAGLSSQTLDGLNEIKAGAAAGSPTAQAGNSFVNTLIGEGGTTAGTRSATAGLAGIDPNVSTAGVAGAASTLSDPNSLARTTGARLAGGAYGTDASAVTGLANGLATGTTQTQRSLQDIADGRYLGGANPYLDAIINRSANEAAGSVAQRFAASGRYGSGRFSGAVADAVDNVGTQLRYNDYSTERDRQAQAASAIDSAGLARAGMAGSLLSTAAGVNQGNAGIAAQGAGLSLAADQAGLAGETALAGLASDNTNRSLSQAGTLLSAAQVDRAAGMAGVENIGALQRALIQPGATMAGVGSLLDQDKQSQLDASISLFNDQQTNPWKGVGLASSIIDPIASLGGTSTGTAVTKTAQPSFLQQLIGVGLAGANVASKFV